MIVNDKLRQEGRGQQCEIIFSGLARRVLLAASGAHAQTYRRKPIRLVVPFAPGGPANITARTIGPRLTESSACRSSSISRRRERGDRRRGCDQIAGMATRAPVDTASPPLTWYHGDKAALRHLARLQAADAVMFTGRASSCCIRRCGENAQGIFRRAGEIAAGPDHFRLGRQRGHAALRHRDGCRARPR